jgi:hypothetical protein
MKTALFLLGLGILPFNFASACPHLFHTCPGMGAACFSPWSGPCPPAPPAGGNEQNLSDAMSTTESVVAIGNGPNQFQAVGYGCHGNPMWDQGSQIAAQNDADLKAKGLCSPLGIQRVSEYQDELLDPSCERTGKPGYSASAEYICTTPAN